MISFLEALNLIGEHLLHLETIDCAVSDSHLRVISEEVFAPIDLPPFDNSAVDGFAVVSDYLKLNPVLPIATSVRAQKQAPMVLPPYTAMRIMTGAPIPHGADAVAMIEDVELLEGRAHFQRLPKIKDNVRIRGEDIQKGAQVFAKGTVVTPHAIGLLCGLGFERVRVFKTPAIRIISTGDELQEPGKPLDFGQVYYLMGPMLKAQCALRGLTDVSYERVADDEMAIVRAIERAHDADIIVLTGGMSKGEYDFVRFGLSRVGVQEVFYQGAWRPGKPLYFGNLGTTRVFGLPGNPVAAFVCFHVFVNALITKSMGVKSEGLRKGLAKNDFVKKPGFTFFARVTINEDSEVTFHTGQGSHQITSLSKANGLCLVPADRAIVKAGEVVHYYALG